MPWSIEEGPYDAPWGGRDAAGWVWIATNPHGERHPLTVWVSGTAMAVAPEYLPDETAAARATQGRSEVERLLDNEVLPREVMLSTTGRSIDPGESGWWVELRGDERDLRGLVQVLGEGEVTAVERGDQVFLRADAFSEMADEQEVRVSAVRLVREAVGAAWLDGHEMGAVEVGAVRRLA